MSDTGGWCTITAAAVASIAVMARYVDTTTSRRPQMATDVGHIATTATPVAQRLTTMPKYPSTQWTAATEFVLGRRAVHCASALKRSVGARVAGRWAPSAA